MTPVLIFGWLAAIVAMLIGVPQLVRLLRTRDTNGLALVLWQAILAINIGWSVHGAMIGALNMLLTNLAGLASTLPTLALIIRARRLRAWRALVPGLLGGAAMVAVDLIFGSAAFGVIAVVPAMIANLGQSVALVRSPRISGVSPWFLVGQFANQALWTVWAILLPDAGTMITAPVTGVVAAFNVIWWVLRRLGLRAFFVQEAAPDLVPPERAPVS